MREKLPQQANGCEVIRMGFIVGLGGEQEYKIGKVNYVVTSSFLPPKEKIGLKDRMARVITSDFTDWTDKPATDNIDTEYMCSTVGKGD